MFDKTCVHCPIGFSKHCKKENQGDKSINKAKIRAIKRKEKALVTTGKGYFFCSKGCRFYEVKGGIQ